MRASTRDATAPTFERSLGRTRRNVRSQVAMARMDRQALQRAAKARARAEHAKAKAKYDGDRLKALKVLQIKRETEERSLLCACDVDWCRTRCRQLYWGLDHLGEFVYPRDRNLPAPDSSHYVHVSTSLAIKWLTKHAAQLGYKSAPAALREFRMRKPQFAAWHFAPEMFEDPVAGDAARGGAGALPLYGVLKPPRRPENAEVEPTYHTSRKFDVKWVRTVERARRAGTQSVQRRNRLFGVKYSDKTKLRDRKQYGRALREKNKVKEAERVRQLLEREQARRRRLVLRSRVRPTRRPASEIARERKRLHEEQEALKAAHMARLLDEQRAARKIAIEKAHLAEIAEEQRKLDEAKAQRHKRKAAEVAAVHERAARLAAQGEAYRRKEDAKVRNEAARVEKLRREEEIKVEGLQQAERDRVAKTMKKRVLEQQADDAKIAALVEEARQRKIDAAAALEKKVQADLDKIATLARENKAREDERAANQIAHELKLVEQQNAKRAAIVAAEEKKKKDVRKAAKKEKKRLAKLAAALRKGEQGVM